MIKSDYYRYSYIKDAMFGENITGGNIGRPFPTLTEKGNLKLSKGTYDFPIFEFKLPSGTTMNIKHSLYWAYDKLYEI